MAVTVRAERRGGERGEAGREALALLQKKAQNRDIIAAATTSSRRTVDFNNDTSACFLNHCSIESGGVLLEYSFRAPLSLVSSSGQDALPTRLRGYKATRLYDPNPRET